MKVFITLLSFFVLTPAKTLHHKLHTQTRIVGGQEATSATQFPHFALLRYLGAFTCGGSIMNEKWILSATHCLNNGREAQYFTIQVGTIFANDESAVLHAVEAIFMHEKYFPLINDVGLLLLKEKLVTSPAVKPIKIYREPTKPGTEVIVCGFGRLYQGGPVAEKLMWIRGSLLSRADCILGTGNLHPGTCCVDSEKNQGVCNGDSGGPLVVIGDGGELYQIGVVVFALPIGQCAAGYPDGYSNATYYWKWIDSTIAKHSNYRLE